MTQNPIVLIENDRAYANLIRAAFGQAGVLNPIQVVGTDREAMRFLSHLIGPPHEEIPAMIVLAILPQLCNHSRMVRWIRQQPALLDVPCVVFSANDPQGANRVPRELVCDFYQQKPQDFDDLVTLAAQLRDRWLKSAKV